MSKIMIGSTCDVTLRMAEAVSPKFTRTVDLRERFGSVVAFGKLGIKTNNIFSSDLGFAVGVGTFVYEGVLDDDALAGIFRDFSGNVRDMQRKIVGSYALAIWKGGKLTIFVDSNGIYDLYYCFEDGFAAICNSLFLIGAALPKVSINSEAMVQQLFQSCVIGTDSIIRGVSKLSGDQSIEWVKRDWRLVPLHDVSFGVRDFEELASATVTRYGGLRECFSSPAVAMTGGQDSRLALAVLLGAKIDPRLVYWRGNSISTNTKERDFECVREIADKCALDIELWDASDSCRDRYVESLYSFGEYSRLYGYNENLIAELYATSCDFLTFGYFGEIFRNIEEIDAYPNEVFSIEEYFDELCLRGGYKKIYPEYQNYREHRIKDLRYICKKLNLDPERLSKDDFQHLNTETYRKRADTHMTNFVNQFRYSFPLLGDRMLTDTMNDMGYKERVGSRPMLKMLDQLAPDLLSVPFFSHIRRMKVDARRLVLREGNSLMLSVKQYLQRNKKNAWYYSAARKAYHIINRDGKSLREISGEDDARKPLLEALAEAEILSMLDRDQLQMLELDSNILLDILHYEYMFQEMVRA